MYYFFRLLLTSIFILKIACIQFDCKAEKSEAKPEGNLQATGYVKEMNELSFLYYCPNRQKSNTHFDSALEFYRKINFTKGKAAALRNFCRSQGNYPLALEFYLASDKILEETLYYREKTRSFNSLALVYRELKNYDVAISYLYKSSHLLKRLGDNRGLGKIFNNLSSIKKYDSVLRFDDKFTYAIDVDEAIDINLFKIPTLLIQPYVENAIWHGLLHKNLDRKLSITPLLEDKILIYSIKDNRIGRKKASELKGPKTNAHKSKGMAITQDILALISKIKEHKIKLSISDPYDEARNAASTCIEIRIPDFINTL